MYEFVAPLWAGKTAGFPWNQSLLPSGLLLFCMNHPGRLPTSAKPSARPQVATLVEADAESDPTLLVALAVLKYVPPLLLVVPLTTWTWALALAFRVVGATSVSFGGEPAIDQPGLEPGTSIDQSIPLPDGRLSVTESPVAVAGALFVTVT